MKDCEYCKEGRNSRVTGIKIIYEYEDPYAYQYPDVAFWNKVYQTDSCPICGRKIDEMSIGEIKSWNMVAEEMARKVDEELKNWKTSGEKKLERDLKRSKEV